MNIFSKIKNSIYGPEYYNEALKKPFAESFKYYVIFALLFAIPFTIVATIKFAPGVKFLADQAPKVANYFPKDLKINIKDGKAATNVQEPYFVKMPQSFKGSTSTKPDISGLSYVIVLDTKDKFNIDAFNSYKTFALLNSDSIAYLDKNNQITVTPLAGIKNFSLSRVEIAGFINNLKPFFDALYPFALVGLSIGLYVFGFIAVMAHMVYLFFGALLILLTADLKGLKIGYKKAYQAGLHLMVAPIIITGIIGAIPGMVAIPYLFSILLVLSAALNLNNTLDTSTEKE